MDTSITLFCPGALAGRFEEAIAGVGPRAADLLQRLLLRARRVSRDASRPGVTSIDPGPGPHDPFTTAANDRSGRAAVDRDGPEERWLRARFELAREAGIGAFAGVQADGALPSGWVIRLSSLHVGLDHLVLLPADSIDLSETESDELLAASQRWLADEPVKLDPIAPGLWQLTELKPELTRLDQMQGSSSRQATGRNIDAWLPSGPSARGWRRLANELQMLWHLHPVNLAREQRGLPVINGLWFEGRTIAPRVRPFDALISRDPVLLGLGRAVGARTVELAHPSAITAALTDPGTPPGTRWLIDPGCWQSQSEQGDASAWREGWRAFGEWLTEFDAAIRPGRGTAMRWLLSGHQHAVELELTRFARFRVWHRLPPQQWFEVASP